MRVSFGEFVLDTDQRALLRAGVEQALEPKVYECLALLVSQAGKLTSMRLLRASLWPDVHVGDGALRRVINEARKALGDTGSTQAAIRTRKGLGYVFVPAVRAESVVADQPVAATTPSWPFVGRKRELDTLRAWASAAGGGGLCWLSGEAGAGKTSLLARLQLERAGNGHTLLAQCQATVGMPAFWPFRELAAQLMRQPELRARAAPLVQAPRSVLRLFPEFEGDGFLARVDGVPAPQRFELCEAFAALLVALSRAAALWLVIEDVHWADTGSLEMLEAIARYARSQALYVVATYRPEAVAPGTALSQWIGRSSGREGVIGVHLPALDLTDVQALLRELSVSGWAGGAARELQQLTGGNALFLSELVRQALALGQPPGAALPLSLNHIVAQRVSALAEPTQRRLDQAAVLGHEFQLDVLAALAGDVSAAALLAELDPALRAGVLRAAPERVDRLQFSHALVGDALVQRLALQDRSAYHLAALRAWQKVSGAAAPSGMLAAHAFEAGVQLPSAERRRLCERAGRDAFEALAFDRAVLHLGRAVQLLEPHDRSRAAAELTLLWAKARWYADDPEADIERAFLQAAASARRAELPELLAEAASGYAIGDESSIQLRGVALRPEAVELVEEAWALLLQTTPGGVEALSGEVAYRLAAARCWMRSEAGDVAEFESAARLALRLAPAAPEPVRRLWLLALQGAADIERLDEVLEAAQALMQAEELDPIQRIEVWALTMGSRLMLGDRQGYQRAVREISRLVELMPQPSRIGRRGARVLSFMVVPRCADVTLAVMRGELERALQLFAAVGEEGVRLGLTITPEQTDHMFCLLLQLYGYQGKSGQLEAALDRHLESNPGAQWFVALAKVQFALERGDRGVAARHFALLRETGFRPMLRGKQLLARPETLVRMADACRELGTPADATILYDALSPRARHCIQDGALICLGACARPLAELAMVQGRHADAERHFRDALAENERLDHRPELARTRLGWARMAIALGRREVALAPLAAARASAQEFGMLPLVALSDLIATR